MSDRDFIRATIDSLHESLDNAFKRDSIQEEINKVVLYSNDDITKGYREMVLRQELGLYAYKETDDGFFTLMNNPVSEEEMNKVLDNVDKRMMTESPILVKEYLHNVAGKIVPDKDRHTRKSRREM